MVLDQPIPLITEPPLPSDPEEVFDAKANAALLSMNAAILAANRAFQTIGLMFGGSSTSTVEIGGGIKNFVVEPALFWYKGLTLKAVYSGDISKSMLGEIESYNITTGELALFVSKANGNGAYSDWIFGIAVSGGGDANLGYAVTTGTSTAYELELAEPIAEYKDGQIFQAKLHTTCDTNPTLRVSELNPPLDIKIQDAYGEYVNAYKGDLLAGHYSLFRVILDGTAVLAESAIDVNTRVGMTYDTFGFEPDLNTFEVPLVPTNISRAAYPKLLKKLIKSSAVTISIANPGVVTWVNHLLENGSPIYLTTTGALPTGHTVNAVRYVVNKTNDNFQLSLTVGGAPIATTGIQSGIHTAHYAPWGNGDGATTFGCPYIPSDYTEIRGSAGNLGTVFVGEALVPDGIQPVTTGPVRNFTYATGSTESGYLPINITAQNGGSANLAAGIRVMKLIVYQ